MSEPVKLAKNTREYLASALSALQSDANVPDELMEVADPIAEAMSVLHRIERSGGASLHGREVVLLKVRSALDLLQDLKMSHPAIDTVMDAVALALSRAAALRRYAPSAVPVPAPVIAPTVVEDGGLATRRSELSVPSEAAAPARHVPEPAGVGPVVSVAPAVPHMVPQPVTPPAPAPAPQPIAFAPQPIASPVPHPIALSMPAPQPVISTPVLQPIAAPIAPAPQLVAAAPALQPVVAASAPQSIAHIVASAISPRPIAAAPALRPAIASPAPSVESQQSASVVVPAGAPIIDVELETHSASNFYKGLGGNDVVEHGGIFVATYKFLKIGSMVSLRVLLPGNYEFQANAVVQWTRERGVSVDSAEPGFGARFTQITQEGRQLVYRYTHNREPIFYDDL